jgi:hypothetical protein
LARITDYNDALRALAETRGLRYVDMVDALADESGYLRRTAPRTAST